MSGYFYLERGLFEHSMFKSREPFSSREAWIWLIEKANFADSMFRHKGAMFPIPRGAYAGSYRSIAENWKWSPNRVIRELKLWENENMVVLETEHGFIQITLCNYSQYQDKRNADGTMTEHERNTDGTLTDTNQRKVRKEIKESKGGKTPVCDVTVAMVDAWAKEHIPASIDLARELAKFKNYDWRKKKEPEDGVKAFRNWLLKAVEFKERDTPPSLPWFQTPANKMPSPAGG